MRPQTCRIWNLGMTKMTSRLYTLLFTWKYAFYEAACFSGLFWTHEKAILSSLLEAGFHHTLHYFIKIILDNWNETLRPPLPPFQWRKKIGMFLFEREFIIDSGGGILLFFHPRLLFPVTTYTGITQYLQVEWCMFIFGVGCNFFGDYYSSCMYLRFSFGFFFRQSFPLSKSFTSLLFILELCYFAEISIRLLAYYWKGHSTEHTSTPTTKKHLK